MRKGLIACGEEVGMPGPPKYHAKHAYNSKRTHDTTTRTSDPCLVYQSSWFAHLGIFGRGGGRAREESVMEDPEECLVAVCIVQG
eukprot:14186763-Alexandrium_andersonii.AAC.1